MCVRRPAPGEKTVRSVPSQRGRLLSAKENRTERGVEHLICVCEGTRVRAVDLRVFGKKRDARWRLPRDNGPCAYPAKGKFRRQPRNAAEKPGPYFVFSSYSRSPGASVDPTSLLRRGERECA